MDVTEVQQALFDLGFDPNGIDGIWGPGSQRACMEYQRSVGLPADGIPGPQTQEALQRSLQGESDGKSVIPPKPMPLVMQRAESLGYKVWGDPYRLWLFGIRAANRTSDLFDDVLGACWTEGDGYWRCEYWPGTTDPGTYWLENPGREQGTAILVEGQYIDCWKIGYHRGEYEALKQCGPVKVYRDANRDANLDLDPNKVYEGLYGINIHAATRKSGGKSTSVHKWSAGCQVHATEAGFSRMMELANIQADKGDILFSYTLLDEW